MPSPKVDKVQIGAPLPRALWKKTKKYAIDRGITASAVIVEALTKLMADNPKAA